MGRAPADVAHARRRVDGWRAIPFFK